MAVKNKKSRMALDIAQVVAAGVEVVFKNEGDNIIVELKDKNRVTKGCTAIKNSLATLHATFNITTAQHFQ